MLPEWFKTTEPQWYNYVISLPEDQQLAYLVTVFNNQVLNGGLHQYFRNGYGQFVHVTINHIYKINAKKAAKLLDEALKLINTSSWSPELFRFKLLNQEIDPLFDSEELADKLGQLDSIYDSAENVIELAERYLEN